MNREILFRAKRTDNGEWVEGNLITGVFFRCGQDIPYILNADMAYYDCFEDFGEENGIFEVFPETLCQYTGLNDKNGKKIWENDILRGHGNDKDLSKVVYGEFGVRDVEILEVIDEVIDEVIGWHYEVIPTDAVSECEPFCFPMPLTDYYIKRCEFEVIGNIFDNQKLLEGT